MGIQARIAAQVATAVEADQLDEEHGHPYLYSWTTTELDHLINTDLQVGPDMLDLGWIEYPEDNGLTEEQLAVSEALKALYNRAEGV